jgi:hypothetical protein
MESFSLRQLRTVTLKVATVALTACSNPASPTLTTGLTGTVLRGPIMPVCTIADPCEAPFSAAFTVQRNGNRVAQFQSDAEGQFTVMLAAGAYQVIPGSGAPLIFPTSQVKEVIVANDGLTIVVLHFDTGIR